MGAYNASGFSLVDLDLIARVYFVASPWPAIKYALF